MLKSVRNLVAMRLIGSPLERPVRAAYWLLKMPVRLRHPDFKEVFAEGARTERLLQRAIGPDACCIDVGAHFGSTLQQMVSLAPQGRHIAFEPTPAKARWLRQKFPQCVIMECALSDAAGEAVFYMQPEQSGYNGLRPHSVTGEVVETRVQVARLDDKIPDDFPVAFLKIDVEGAELDVLRGATAILQRYRPTVLFECTETGNAAFSQDPKDVFHFLIDTGYRVYLIKDWLDGGDPLTERAFLRAIQYPFQAYNFFAAPTS